MEQVARDLESLVNGFISRHTVDEQHERDLSAKALLS